MGSYAERGREAMAASVRIAVHRWVASLPPEGFRGTVDEIEGQMHDLSVGLTYHERGHVPTGRGITVALENNLDLVRAVGFELQLHRTSAQRFIVLVPIRRCHASTP